MERLRNGVRGGQGALSCGQGGSVWGCDIWAKPSRKWKSQPWRELGRKVHGQAWGGSMRSEVKVSEGRMWALMLKEREVGESEWQRGGAVHRTFCDRARAILGTSRTTEWGGEFGLLRVKCRGSQRATADSPPPASTPHTRGEFQAARRSQILQVTGRGAHETLAPPAVRFWTGPFRGEGQTCRQNGGEERAVGWLGFRGVISGDPREVAWAWRQIPSPRTARDPHGSKRGCVRTWHQLSDLTVTTFGQHGSRLCVIQTRAYFPLFSIFHKVNMNPAPLCTPKGSPSDSKKRAVRWSEACMYLLGWASKSGFRHAQFVRKWSI